MPAALLEHLLTTRDLDDVVALARELFLQHSAHDHRVVREKNSCSGHCRSSWAPTTSSASWPTSRTKASSSPWRTIPATSGVRCPDGAGIASDADTSTTPVTSSTNNPN